MDPARLQRCQARLAPVRRLDRQDVPGLGSLPSARHACEREGVARLPERGLPWELQGQLYDDEVPSMAYDT